MAADVLRIEVSTRDQEFLSDLRAEQIGGISLGWRAFTCDAVEWVPPVEQVLKFVIEVSKDVEIALLTQWLYQRFVSNPPEAVVVNDLKVSVDPVQISITINQLYIHNVTNIGAQSSSEFDAGGREG